MTHTAPATEPTGTVDTQVELTETDASVPVPPDQPDLSAVLSEDPTDRASYARRLHAVLEYMQARIELLEERVATLISQRDAPVQQDIQSVDYRLQPVEEIDPSQTDSAVILYPYDLEIGFDAVQQRPIGFSVSMYDNGELRLVRTIGNIELGQVMAQALLSLEDLESCLGKYQYFHLMMASSHPPTHNESSVTVEV